MGLIGDFYGQLIMLMSSLNLVEQHFLILFSIFVVARRLSLCLYAMSVEILLAVTDAKISDD